MNIGLLEGIMPVVNFAARTRVESGTDWDRRFIPDYQLFYVISGRAEMWAGNRIYDIGSGDSAYYGPECPVLLKAVEPVDFFSIHFEWNRASPQPEHPAHRMRLAGEEIAWSELPLHSITVAPHGEISLPNILSLSGLEDIFTRLVKEYELEQPGYELALRGQMMQAITLIVRQLLDTRTSADSPGRIEPALQAMREQPEKNWLVAELACLCGYHPIHFAKLFKEEVGLLPKHYIIGERIKLAKRALLQGEKMEAISERLGFASIHYFSHQFKQVTGLTPTEYRLQGRI